MDSLDSLVSGTSVSAVSGVETRIESAALQPLSSLDFSRINVTLLIEIYKTKKVNINIYIIIS